MCVTGGRGTRPRDSPSGLAGRWRAPHGRALLGVGGFRARGGLSAFRTGARCRHREGVVDIVRGLSTPRGGYNARSCQQRASVPTTRVGSYNQRPRRWPSPAPGATVAEAHWHGNLPTPMGVSRSDAVGLTQEAAAGRAMSTSMVALNGRPGAPGRLLTHGPRRARAQSHRGRQFA